MILPGGTPAVQGTIEVEVAFLRDAGFTPSEIERPAGPFFLAIKNRSRADSMAVQVVRNEDGKVLVVPVSSLAGGQTFLLTLAHGIHVVADTDHPNRSPLTITIH